MYPPFENSTTRIAITHNEPNGAISSNKKETCFDLQNFYDSRLYLKSSQLIIIALLILLVTYFVKLYALNFEQNWVLTPCLRILCSNQFQKKNHRTITGGPWWTQIKVVHIQKGVLGNKNPCFCMGWPGL